MFHSSYFAIKNRLSNIISNQKDLSIINDAVSRTHQIVIHTYQFIKLYLIHLLDNHLPFPTIDREFIYTCMIVLTYKKDKRGGEPEDATLALLDDLQPFYEQYYYPLNPHKISRHLLGQILEYEATGILTDITNNIETHYLKYVRRFIDHQFNLRAYSERIKKSGLSSNQIKLKLQDLWTEVREIKQDLLTVTKNYKFISEPKHHAWLTYFKTRLLPDKLKFDKDYVPYDIKSHPLDYLPCMFYLNQQFEQNGLKLFHPFPVRAGINPKYITIDTDSLIRLLVTKNKTKYLKSINKYKPELWNAFFNIKKRSFKKGGYGFNHMIKTDGIGVSIILVPIGLLGKKNIPSSPPKEDAYIDKVSHPEATKNKWIVGVDPNKGDLIYCSDADGNTFRYTNVQRKFETGSKKYDKYLLKAKNQTRIEGKTVIEWETELTFYCAKTCYFDKFGQYIENKARINNKLYGFYINSKARKFKFNRYINTQRSEQQMINNFKDIFGGPDEVVVAFGDHTQGGHQMKYHVPTKDKGMRKIFQKNHYELYLVNEDRTSKTCHKCLSEVAPFSKRPSPRPWQAGKIVEVFGLVRCKNVNCHIKLNRDYNASQNMVKIAQAALEGKERPEEFRKRRQSGVLTPVTLNI